MGFLDKIKTVTLLLGVFCGSNVVAEPIDIGRGTQISLKQQMRFSEQATPLKYHLATTLMYSKTIDDIPLVNSGTFWGKVQFNVSTTAKWYLIPNNKRLSLFFFADNRLQRVDKENGRFAITRSNTDYYVYFSKAIVFQLPVVISQIKITHEDKIFNNIFIILCGLSMAGFIFLITYIQLPILKGILLAVTISSSLFIGYFFSIPLVMHNFALSVILSAFLLAIYVCFASINSIRDFREDKEYSELLLQKEKRKLELHHKDSNELQKRIDELQDRLRKTNIYDEKFGGFGVYNKQHFYDTLLNEARLFFRHKQLPITCLILRVNADPKYSVEIGKCLLKLISEKIRDDDKVFHMTQHSLEFTLLFFNANIYDVKTKVRDLCSVIKNNFTEGHLKSIDSIGLIAAVTQSLLVDEDASHESFPDPSFILSADKFFLETQAAISASSGSESIAIFWSDKHKNTQDSSTFINSLGDATKVKEGNVYTMLMEE